VLAAVNSLLNPSIILFNDKFDSINSALLFFNSVVNSNKEAIVVAVTVELPVVLDKDNSDIEKSESIDVGCIKILSPSDSILILKTTLPEVENSPWLDGFTGMFDASLLVLTLKEPLLILEHLKLRIYSPRSKVEWKFWYKFMLDDAAPFLKVAPLESKLHPLPSDHSFSSWNLVSSIYSVKPSVVGLFSLYNSIASNWAWRLSTWDCKSFTPSESSSKRRISASSLVIWLLYSSWRSEIAILCSAVRESYWAWL